MSNGFLAHLKRKMIDPNTLENIVVDTGNVAQDPHVFGENLLAVKSSFDKQIPQLTMVFRPIMGNGKSQVLVAENRVGVFGHLHIFKVWHFAIIVKDFL